jgi:hypothetical protein
MKRAHHSTSAIAKPLVVGSKSGRLAILAAIRRASSRGEELGRRAPAGLLLEIDIGSACPSAVFDDEVSEVIFKQ